MNPDRVISIFRDWGEPAYRGRQLIGEICKGIESYQEVTTLPQGLRDRLGREMPVLSFSPDRVLSSADGSCHKALVSLNKGARIETVLMSPKPGLWSACVSSQAGCALACSFCATGLMGFRKNLTAEEIADQVLFWRQYHRRSKLAGKITNVVYMGMGEPMLNFDAVKESVAWLTSPILYGMAQRSLSISTAGIVPGIDRLTRELGQVNLAVSLHAADDELRGRLVPINRAYPLDALKKALGRYFSKNNRKVFLEYVLLAQENDQTKHAQDLVRWIRRAGPIHLLHVNLIVWNPTATAHQATDRESARLFKEHLISRGIQVTIRKNLGQEIAGACGQLVVGRGTISKKPFNER
ncbi:MAG: 23S rRNA (adenine(2503)-C(2))-methyltransferase RlmN [Elusimicrobia bacterium]|nr:23S rRNA (adenine(2503)-C(2))-methyltransferase RlmN [Elusimicrobiota bacterium]